MAALKGYCNFVHSRTYKKNAGLAVTRLASKGSLSDFGSEGSISMFLSKKHLNYIDSFKLWHFTNNYTFQIPKDRSKKFNFWKINLWKNLTLFLNRLLCNLLWIKWLLSNFAQNCIFKFKYLSVLSVLKY